MPHHHHTIQTNASANHLGRAAALLCLGLCAQIAQAGIDTSANPDLFFTLIDQTTAKMSYTLDLNVKATDFYINAQQDSGSYLFFTLDPSKDASLQAFVAAAGANMSTTRWAVLGFAASEADPSQRVLYSTLSNDGAVATQTANYDKLHGVNNNTFKQNNAFAAYITALNSAVPGTDIQSSTLNTAATFGSSLATVANAGATYANMTRGFSKNPGTGAVDGDCIYTTAICVGNDVGTSSWFYQTQLFKGAGSNNLSKVSVDEFDNLTNDGYWGFTKNPTTGLYVLSYTLPGSNPKSLVSTAEGRARLSFTDYSAQSGTARLIGIGNGDIANIGIDAAITLANAGAIAAVPEPQTWGLMSLGGLLVAVAARRRATSAQGV